MKSIKNMLLVMALALLVGCTTNGVKVETEQLANIQKGVTTEQEVLAMLGEPTSMTTLPERKVLHYDYQMSDQMGRSMATSAASIVGGMVAGPLGSMAGSMAGRSIASSSIKERLIVEIDPVTSKVLTYRHEKSQTNS